MTRIRVIDNDFDSIARALPDIVSQIVGKVAHDIEADAKTRVRVDSGNLKNSLRTDQDGTEQTRWYVSTNVEYAPYQELGTRHMPAHPFLLPAAEAARGPLVDALRSLEAELGRHAR